MEDKERLSTMTAQLTHLGCEVTTCDITDNEIGLLVNGKYVVSTTSNKWSVLGKTDIYRMKNIEDFVKRYVNRNDTVYNAIKRINDTPIELLEEVDYKALRPGRDRFSRMNQNELEEITPKDVVKALSEHYQYGDDNAVALRYYQRGIKDVEKIYRLIEAKNEYVDVLIGDYARRRKERTNKALVGIPLDEVC